MQKLKTSSAKMERCVAPWVREEFAGAKFPDKRLLERAQWIMTQFGEQPGASIPQACGQWSDIKAAYRFFDNDSIEPAMLLAPHTAATVARMQEHEVVLAIQDTTTLNYSTHPETEGLGPIGNNPDKTLGLFVHTTLALSTAGKPLGILGLSVRARNTRDFGLGRDSQRRNRQAVEQKESQRWLDSLSDCQQIASGCACSLLVNVADREGDIYELFAQALSQTQDKPVHLLIRVQHNRQVEAAQRLLWPYLASQPVAGRLQVKVPRQAGQAQSMSELEIRFQEVMARAPLLKEGQPSLKLWAIEAREPSPAKNRSPILWRLLTTLPVQTVEQARERVNWYAQRWQIEVFHKVLKSGCKIEQRQLETAARLRRILIMDMIVAWRVMLLSKAARETPGDSAGQWLLESEWKVLWCHMNPGKQPPKRAPELRQAVRWIGQLGGFIGRKSDGEPGPVVLWRGLQRLNDLTHAYNLLRNVGNA
jgi:hypothetical protein